MSPADSADKRRTSAEIREISGKQKTIYIPQMTQINAENKISGKLKD